MKKLMFAAAIAASAMLAQADVAWSWWLDNKMATPDVSLGIASKCMSVSALEFSLLYSASSVKDGAQLAFFVNDSSSDCALQLTSIFNRGGDPCVQLGMINVADKNVFNLGFINIADESKVQLGFLNFNKNGFLPVFPFINLDMSLFK